MRRMRLSIVGPIEDQPRLLRAHGRIPGGELAMVLRPGGVSGLVVRVSRSDGVFIWEAGSDGDSPQLPAETITLEEAVSKVKTAQESEPPEGPTTLRGRWSGTLTVDDRALVIELKRKIAAYGTLWVTSSASGWSWRFERASKWFSVQGDDHGTGHRTLSAAIEAGVLGAMSLVREACSFRDTRRRAVHDTDYAQKHPIRVPKPSRNPTERFGVRRRRRRAAPPAPVEDSMPTQPAPTSKRELEAMTLVAAAEGDALGKLTGDRWLWDEPTPPHLIAEWFEQVGLEQMALTINDFDGSPGYTPSQLLADLERDLKGSGLRGRQPELHAEATGRLTLLRSSLESTPALMERARKLIRYATTMARSPRCRGRDRDEALEAIERAITAYDSAREAIIEGRSWDARSTLRRIGERVALSAAKAARSCGRGQTSFTARVRTTPTQVPAPRPARRDHTTAPNSSPRLSEGDIIEVHGDVGIKGLVDGRRFRVSGVEESRGQTLYRMNKLSKTGRVLKSQVRRMVSRVDGLIAADTAAPRLSLVTPATATPAPASRASSPPPAEAAPTADASKDKALLDAFSSAIAAALGEAA